MRPIKTNKEIWGKDFPIGGEWDAGLTPPHTPANKSGRWTVRREETRFVVLFYRFHDHQETLLKQYPATEQGEIDAKTCAISARHNHQTTPFTSGE
jgi:hypothetical protein